MDGRMQWRGVPLFGPFMTGSDKHRPHCPDCKQELKPERFKPEWLSRDAMSYPSVQKLRPASNAAYLETNAPNRGGHKSVAIWYGSPFYPPVIFVPTRAQPQDKATGSDDTQRVVLPRKQRRDCTDMPVQRPRPREMDFRPTRKRYLCASHHNLLVQDRIQYMGPPVGKGMEELRESTEKQLECIPAGLLSSQAYKSSSRRHFPPASSATQVAQAMKHVDSSKDAGQFDLEKVRKECLEYVRSGPRPGRRMFPTQPSILFHTAGYRGEDPYKWDLMLYAKCKKII